MTTLADERRAQFKSDVDDLKLKTGQSRVTVPPASPASHSWSSVSSPHRRVRLVAHTERPARHRVVPDPGHRVPRADRDRGALYLAAAIARVLRLWLLRQLRTRARRRRDQIAAALSK